MKILLLLLIALPSYSAIHIRVNGLNGFTDQNFVQFLSINSLGSLSNQLYTDGSDAVHSEASAMEVFVPISASGAASPAAGETLFLNYIPDPGNAADDILAIPVYQDDGVRRDVWVAYETNSGGNDWQNVPIGSSAFNIANTTSIQLESGDSDDTQFVYFRVSDIFNEKVTDWTATTIEEDVKIVVYTYDESVLDAEKDVDITELTDDRGAFFEIKISNEVPGPDVAISRLDPLDGQAKAEIANVVTTNLPDGIYKMGFYVSSNPADSKLTSDNHSTTFAAVTAANFVLLDGAEPGTVTIPNLINDTTYYITAGFVSRFQIVGTNGPTLSVKPDQILTFLREKSCFIISAGFGEDHYVIEYFRGFRDRVLTKFEWGRSFISWYYKNSPAVAVKVYHNKIVKNLVKLSSFGLYLLMNYYYFFIGAILLIVYGRKRYLKMV